MSARQIARRMSPFQKSTNNTIALGIFMPNDVKTDGKYLWCITNGQRQGIRLSDMSLTGIVACGAGPLTQCFDGRNWWVANFTSSTLSIYDLVGNKVGGDIPCGGASPEGIMHLNDYIWVCHCGGNTVSKINSLNGAIAGTYVVGNGPDGITVDHNGYIWVSCFSDGTLVKIDESGTVLQTVTLNAGANGPNDITLIDKYLYAACSSNSTLYKVNADTGVVVNTLLLGAVGLSPRGLANIDNFLYVANSGNGTVTAVRYESMTVAAVKTVGDGPRGMCTDGINLWVANSNSGNALSRL